MDGHTIYAYSPEMMIFEKLRAICQQMPEYTEAIGKTTRTAMARDFFDIYVVLKHFKICLTTKVNLDICQSIFQQKEVPLQLLKHIPNYRAFHSQDFVSVEDTAKPKFKLKKFDFYFDYVLKKSVELSEAFGVI